MMTRREMLRLTLAAPLLAPARSLDRRSFDEAPSSIVTIDGAPLDRRVQLRRSWVGPLCRARLTNRSRSSVRIKEVVLFDLPLALPPETRLYGEGFQMLSQTGGTLGRPVDYGSYTDAKHYRMAIAEGARACYGMMTLTPPGDQTRLLAFTSCRRWSGALRLRAARLEVVVDTEGLALGPGESWELEEFTFRTGADRAGLLEALGARLAAHHPPLLTPQPPTGWCSWYCFGPRVTARQVLDNLDFIARHAPGLKYIQIDDGYQPAMGDWLETGAAFGGDVRGVLREIRARGFEPAIWIAPFIAEEGSRLFREHPDWFVTDERGAPLRSDRVTFGGWRRGPWYALDGTHPAAQSHLTQVLRVMRREWGVTYFKLDANFWGAIHGGRFHDPRATRITAYRRGMRAVLDGAGESFILGCNHPIWPSLGLIHGSRSSNDIKRTWARIASTARENLSRNWQNGRLWWNDPDAVVLTGEPSAEEILFHATAIYASGGMLLSGDDLTAISKERLALLLKLQPPSGAAARFTDESLRVGRIALQGRTLYCLFNWDDAPQTLSFRLEREAEISDFWTGQSYGRRSGSFTLEAMPPHSARLLISRS